MPEEPLGQAGGANEEDRENDRESVGLEATDRVRGALCLEQRTNAKKMANRFDDHGRSTGKQEKATIELQDLPTEGVRSHGAGQNHCTVTACTSKSGKKSSLLQPVCERLAQCDNQQASLSLRLVP